MEKRYLDVIVKEINEEERTLDGVASTDAVDRMGDVIEQDGWELKNFKKNPVFLWAHDYSKPPLGKVVKIGLEDGKLVFQVKFIEKGEDEWSKFADMIFRLYREKYLRAFSVGFIPKEWEPNDHGGYTFKKQELLEISAVPVPALQDALAFAMKGIKAVPSNHTPPVDEDSSWDASKAVQQLRKWASSDGSGDKDTIDWNKYAKGFGWYDANDKENFGSYKLPHHYVQNGQLVTSKRGVIAAMAALLGARGGVDIPDSERKRVYNHLAKHYEQFDMEPPEFRTAEERYIELVEQISSVLADIQLSLGRLEEKLKTLESEGENAPEPDDSTNSEEKTEGENAEELYKQVAKKLSERLMEILKGGKE